MTKLSVNVNKVALLRNSRKGDVPSVERMSRLALDAGAHGITVHPRPDARHIRPDDVRRLAAVLREPAYQGREFNIEGNPLLPHFLPIVAQARPDQCTLVPDDPGQATSDHGWDVASHIGQLKTIVAELHGIGCRVSLFMDPEPDRIELVPDTGADRIELYTEAYALAYARGGDELARVFDRYRIAAGRAQALGLGVNAGHDLNLDNLAHFLTIPDILEVSIGHALVADALEHGMTHTVRAHLGIVGDADHAVMQRGEA